jgi:hypothetical protein
MLSDSEKFRLIMNNYSNEYDTEEILMLKLGVKQKLFNSWKESNMPIDREIQLKISEEFYIKESVWRDIFPDEAYFFKFIDRYIEYSKDQNIEDVVNGIETGKKITDTQKFNVIFFEIS